MAAARLGNEPVRGRAARTAAFVDFASPARNRLRSVWALRVAIIAAVLAIWEVVAESGWLFRDVVPTVPVIARAVARLLADGSFYSNLAVTGAEIVAALAIGGIAGLVAGLVLGGNRFLARAYEGFIYYLGPTPKIIFFPIMILWFGVGPGSKIAMGALSAFFPIVISVASGMRQIAPVLLRVGKSFRATPWQMTRTIYLPAMRTPIVNGFRLGLGLAIIGALLAETKLSKPGTGLPDHPVVHDVRHAADVRAPDRAVRHRDRPQRADRPLRRQRPRAFVLTASGLTHARSDARRDKCRY
jgi:ABC-type nitrate/sulfonate/bicarbonate transport system permease component